MTETFNSWLESLDQRRTVLLEVDYLQQGQPGVLRLANRPFASTPTDTPPSVPYDDIILSGLTYGARMSGQASGSLSLTIGSVQLAVTPELEQAALFQVAGQKVRVLLGDERWPLSAFQLVAVLTAESLEPESIGRYRLNFRTERLQLNEPLNTAVLSAGPNKDKNKPLLLGDCLNIQPVQADDSGLLWLVSDGAVQSIGAIRVDGVEVSASREPATGSFRLSAPAQGVVTCDAIGQGGAQLKAIVLQLLQRLQVTEIDQASLNSLPAYDAGLYSASGLTARSALDALLSSVAGFWGFDRLGRFRAGLVAKPTGVPVATLTPDDIALDGVSYSGRLRAASSIELLYDINHTVQSGKNAGGSVADRARWSNKSQTLQQALPAVLALYPDAEAKTANTYLRGLSAAQTELAKRTQFLNKPGRLFTVKAFALPFAFQVGQVIRLVYPHLGFAAGLLATILSIQDEPLRGTTTLEVLIDG